MSKIAWTEKTWNPVVGCTKVSLGCKNCYAEFMAFRLANMGQKKYQRVIYHPDIVFEEKKGKWNNKIYCDESALDNITPRQKAKMIFVCSMGDLFHESVPFEFIAKVWKVIAFCEQHIFQVLTKRHDRMLEFVKWLENKYCYDGGKLMFKGDNGVGYQYKEWPLPNLWLGVSAENQEMADKRIPILLQIPAMVRFVSLEPLLGPVDLTAIKWGYLEKTSGCSKPVVYNTLESYKGHGGIDWVIIGAESKGQYPGRRCKINWINNIVAQCETANVPCFVKQLHECYATTLVLEKDSEKLISAGYPQQYPKENKT